MSKPFIVHEGQVYINQALVAEQFARTNADARLDLDSLRESQEPFIGGGLESFDEEKYEKEFRAGVVAVLNEALRPGGLLWKHLTR